MAVREIIIVPHPTLRKKSEKVSDFGPDLQQLIEDMIETLHANILSQEQIADRYGENVGIPIWECFPSSPSDDKAIKNATQTYIGRLVPLSRWLKILPDRNTMLMGEGFVYPVYPKFKETTSVEIVLAVKNKQLPIKT